MGEQQQRHFTIDHSAVNNKKDLLGQVILGIVSGIYPSSVVTPPGEIICLTSADNVGP